VAVQSVRLLGDPLLRQRAREVVDFGAPELRQAIEDLADTLADFRRQRGFGRAISAPQIGVPLRVVAVDLGEGAFFVVNPEIVWRSDETLTMWDDCMSFPDLMVRVRRHRSISLRHRDGQGAERDWPRLDAAAAELLQHEIDHLDGILAVDRALDRDALVLRPVFEARREELVRQVDHVIVPTIGPPAAGALARAL
jgi:peptide deformylase